MSSASWRRYRRSPPQRRASARGGPQRARARPPRDRRTPNRGCASPSLPRACSSPSNPSPRWTRSCAAPASPASPCPSAASGRRRRTRASWPPRRPRTPPCPRECTRGSWWTTTARSSKGCRATSLRCSTGGCAPRRRAPCAGVTRSMVLDLARPLLPPGGGALHVDQLAQARECFITSVSREVLPVVRIDGVAIGEGAPGPVTRRNHPAVRGRGRERGRAAVLDAHISAHLPLPSHTRVTSGNLIRSRSWRESSSQMFSTVGNSRTSFQ